MPVTPMPTSCQQKILLLYNKAEGYNSQAALIKKGLEEHGHKVTAKSDYFIKAFKVDSIRTMCHKIKSIILLWSAFWFSVLYRPDMIIIEDAHFFIPCLKLFTKAKIVQLRYFMVSRREKKITRKPPSEFELKCVGMADEIIVPTRIAAQLTKATYKLYKLPRVIYPCMDIPVPRYQLTNPKLVNFFRDQSPTYLYITDMGPSSAMKKIVDSLCAICDRYNHKLRDLPKLLIIIKDCNISLPVIRSQLDYINALTHLPGKTYNILVHIEKSEIAIRSLIAKCNFLIDTATTDVYNEYFMIAIKYGIPIIGMNSGFSAEIIQSGYNGVFADNKYNLYAKAMSLLNVLPTCSTFTKVIQVLDYRCNYDFRQFAIKHNKYVVEKTAELKVSIVDDMLNRAQWRCAKHTLMYEVVCGYITGFGHLPKLYRYNSRKCTVRSRRYFVNGAYVTAEIKLFDIIQYVNRVDLRSLNLHLSWKQVKFELVDKSRSHAKDDVIIDSAIPLMLKDIKKNRIIIGEIYNMSNVMKRIIGNCAFKLDAL